MKQIRVSLKERSYKILIGRGVIRELPRLMGSLVSTKKVLIVTTPVLSRLLGSKVVSSLKKKGFKVALHLAPEGEAVKTQKELFRILDSALKAGLDRSSAIIALGGGAVGDAAAFAASIYLRGVCFINLPTTLLAQVDSAIGGKTAINLEEGKNLVGTFFQPRLVISEIDFLRTLPKREFVSSLGEIVKYGILASPSLFKYLEQNKKKLLARESKVLEKVIGECVGIKARIVEKDECEKTGLRAALNLGHTFAHTYEKAAKFKKLLHGEAVAMGIVDAARMACARGMLSEREAKRIEDLISDLGLPTSPDKFHFKKNELMSALSKDKKRKGNKVYFILPERIGRVRAVPIKVK